MAEISRVSLSDTGLGFGEGETRFVADSEAHRSRIAVRAAVRVADKWNLSVRQAAALLDVSVRTFHRMKDGTWSGTVGQDLLLRISGLVGLYKGLHLYFSDDLADRWVTLANSGPLFAGHPPVTRMQAGGLPAILQVRDYVDALRGGV